MASTLKILRGGNICNGDGNTKIFKGDVYIVNQHIQKVVAWENGVAPLCPSNAKLVDCQGKLVAPGWIDQHTHYDGQVTWDPYLSPSASAGVTTAIMGNCGIGFAPVRQGKKDREFLLGLVEAVEDIPGAALNVGIDWSWETFPQYLDKIDSLDLACDVGVLIGHAPIRAYVLGERASISDRPGGPLNDTITSTEINAMANIVEEAVASGAMGFSTSRLILHRDSSGILTPGSLASESEMLALGRAVAQGGGGVIEGVFDFFMYDDIPVQDMDPMLSRLHGKREWSWMTNIAKEYDVSFSFAANLNSPRFMMMDRFNKEMKKNMMFAQVFVRPQGLLMSMDSRMNPFGFTPTYQTLKREGKANDANLLMTMDVKNQIIKETKALAQGKSQVAQMFSRMIKLDNTYRWTPGYEPNKEDSCANIARKMGVDEYELFYDWMCTESDGRRGRGVAWRPMFQEDPSLETIRKSFEYEHALPGVADGGAHGTIFTDATANTNLLSWWCRDRDSSKGPQMQIEKAVAKSTSTMARLYNMNDRGVIAAGMKADINVIDMDRISVLQPRHVNDLPTGAHRWLQGVQGYDMTIVSGVVTFIQGQPTGNLPGGLVRNPKAIAAQQNGGVHPLRPYNELLSGIETFTRKDTYKNMKAQDRAVAAVLADDNAGASALGRIANVLRSDTDGKANL